MNDKWEFYKDNQEQWRWRRTAPNGNIVGAATEGYVNKGDCEGNARRNGWETVEEVEQEIADEQAQIKEMANTLYEKHGFKGGDEFAAGFVEERERSMRYRESHHKMQRNFLFTIVMLLCVIIAVLLYDLFKEAPKAIISEKSISELKVMMLVLDPEVDEQVVVFGDTHFDFNQALLTPEAKALLDGDVQTLKDNPDVHVRMAGYTSAQGSKESNQILSEKRANSVRDYLIEQGIAPERITVIGYGRTRPALYEIDPDDIHSKAAQANMRALFEIKIK